MTAHVRLATVPDVPAFREVLARLDLDLPVDDVVAPDGPLLQPIDVAGFRLANRIVVHPMEGWDGTADGRPTDLTFRRWRRFGESGASLVWGGEAVAVRHDGRANPRQLVAAEHTARDLARLRETTVAAWRTATGTDGAPVIGLQLTHSGRYSRPDGPLAPIIAQRHPILDERLGLPADYPLVTDDELRRLVEDFIAAARIAADAGYDFVDVKHCHGYLGHELLAAHTRAGAFGGCFGNRTRFLREVVAGIRACVPGLAIGVRLSAFDTVPFCPDPARSSPGRPGVGVPEPHLHLLPYRWGFGVLPQQPTEPSLDEAVRLVALLGRMNVHLVNLTAGSPYWNPHVQRPALFPPSDGYLPPEDPLVGVVRQIRAVRELKERVPGLVAIGTGYTYLQDYLPQVATALVRAGWVDLVGIGRGMLSCPSHLRDAALGRPLNRRLLCRTFSDCTTAPRHGIVSGCYPLDPHFKRSPEGEKLRVIKIARAAGRPVPGASS